MLPTILYDGRETALPFVDRLYIEELLMVRVLGLSLSLRCLVPWWVQLEESFGFSLVVVGNYSRTKLLHLPLHVFLARSVYPAGTALRRLILVLQVLRHDYLQALAELMIGKEESALIAGVLRLLHSIIRVLGEGDRPVD